MMKYLIFLILLLASKDACTQKYINLEKDKALRELSLYSEKFKLQPIVEMVDATIKYSTVDSLQRHYSFTLHFDSTGKCDVETSSWDCDYCFKKSLDWQLKKSRLGWSKISDTTYLSKARKQVILEVNEKIPFTFVIRRNKLPYNEAVDMLRNKQMQ